MSVDFETRETVTGEIHTAPHHNRYIRNALLWLKTRIDTILGFSRKVTWEIPASFILPGDGVFHEISEYGSWRQIALEFDSAVNSHATIPELKLPSDFDTAKTVVFQVDWFSKVAATNTSYTIAPRLLIKVINKGEVINAIGQTVTLSPDASPARNAEYRSSGGNNYAAYIKKTTVFTWAASKPTAGQTIVIRLQRLSNNAADNMGDIYVSSVLFEFEKS